MRVASALLLVLLMACFVHSEFQQVNLSINVDVSSDGIARVIETVRLQMDSGSPVIYDTAMSAYDLSSWRARTKLDLRFHFNRDIVDISEVSIRAQPRDSCYGCVKDVCTSCHGTLIISYKISPIANKSDSGLFKMVKFKPRTTSYSINPDAFSLESSSSGNMVLPENTQLTITIPQNSMNISVNPLPDGMEQIKFPINNESSFTWRGRTTLSNFELSFQIEEPLSIEVIAFFSSVRDEVLRVFYSKDGIAVIFMLTVVVASLILLKRQEESR